MIDTHAHLDQSEFDGDRSEVIGRAREAGVETMICPGVCLQSSAAAQRLAVEYGLFAAVGIHPNSTSEAAVGDWERIAAMAREPRVVALGETGLDGYWDFATMPLQKEYLERHLRLAEECDLPVILHCRDAQEELLPLLHEAAGRRPLRGVLHAFSGDVVFAEACLGLGLHLSFAGNVTYSNKKFETLRAVARMAPDDRLLLETDAPYLIPQSARGKEKRNEPARMIETAAFLAELRGTSLAQLAATTAENARQLFRLV